MSEQPVSEQLIPDLSMPDLVHGDPSGTEVAWPESESYPPFSKTRHLSPALPYEGHSRRFKAALVLVGIWLITLALHLSPDGYLYAAVFACIMAVHEVRMLTTRPAPLPQPYSPSHHRLPQVSLLVSAKNEEAVIGRLVENLCALNYPRDRYEVWVIDDNSSDRTPQVLEHLAAQYPQVHIHRRGADATGGKSGALNQILPQTKGEVIGVFDADAQVDPDMLLRVLPMFEQPKLGALQVRKAISNQAKNFWTQGQSVEMQVDAYIQTQRITVDGLGELRGNGQFVRRQALERCGGWNEETITDDLDLTFRLHLDQWDVEFMCFPAVWEEGVTTPKALWHQRNRWAEGGYQRYLDYWRPILRNRMGFRKTLDMFLFWVNQYLMPAALIPDLLFAWMFHSNPMLAPISIITTSLPIIAIVRGSRLMQGQAGYEPRPRGLSGWVTLLGKLVMTTLYLFHWIPVIVAVTLRMAIFPKRLKWVKTIHEG
jgi:1,2-diacylglycerol 3-beta-glucosyltransferase